MPSNETLSGELRKLLDGREDRDDFHCLLPVKLEIKNIAKIMADNRKSKSELKNCEEILYNLAYKRVIEKYSWYGTTARFKYPVWKPNRSIVTDVRYDLKRAMETICGEDLWFKDFLLSIELLGFVHEFKMDPGKFSEKIRSEAIECASKTYPSK